MHVLIADQDPDLRLSAEVLLSEEPGVTIVGAASETEGLLALIKSTCPHLVILEWNLPGKPTVEIMTTILSTKARPKVIVASPKPDDQEPALQAGADAFIVKGDPPEHLLAAFRQVRKKTRPGEGNSIEKKE